MSYLALSTKTRSFFNRATIYVVLIFGAALALMPFFWMVSTSLKPLPQLTAWPPEWIPQPFTWRNYPDALTYFPYALYLGNTMIVVIATIVGNLISCTLVAYGFARFRFPGRDFLFMVVIATIMLPVMVQTIPTFILFQKLGWVNTFLPLIVPQFFGNPFYIFLLRQFFLTIPSELLDAARIDGASELYILWRIVLPLSRPVLAVVTIFAFQFAWNDFLGPLIYLNKTEVRTLSIGLFYYLSNDSTIYWNQMMAAATLMVLPVVMIFVAFQRFFVQGVALTGFKG